MSYKGIKTITELKQEVYKGSFTCYDELAAHAIEVYDKLVSLNDVIDISDSDSEDLIIGYNDAVCEITLEDLIDQMDSEIHDSID